MRGSLRARIEFLAAGGAAGKVEVFDKIVSTAKAGEDPAGELTLYDWDVDRPYHILPPNFAVGRERAIRIVPQLPDWAIAIARKLDGAIIDIGPFLILDYFFSGHTMKIEVGRRTRRSRLSIRAS